MPETGIPRLSDKVPVRILLPVEHDDVIVFNNMTGAVTSYGFSYAPIVEPVGGVPVLRVTERKSVVIPVPVLAAAPTTYPDEGLRSLLVKKKGFAIIEFTF